MHLLRATHPQDSDHRGPRGPPDQGWRDRHRLSAELPDRSDRVWRPQRSREPGRQAPEEPARLRPARRAQHAAAHDLPGADPQPKPRDRNAMTVTAERPSEYPVMLPGVTLTSLAAHIGDSVLRPKVPLWWWIGFLFSLSLLLVLVVACAWLFINGIGVWGVDIPVAGWLAISEYVWWIALASGGTIVSALFYLTRSPWRAAISRIAETMMLCAAAAAGIMPILHLGRPGLFYWLFPYPNVMGIWPQFRSPLLWDFVCLLCYILMSMMFYYTGLLPDLATLRDRAETRGWQVFYGILALGWRGSAGQWRHYKLVYFIMAAIMAPMVISVHSVVGLDFAGGLTPGWHSTQFPPYFFFGAVISGIALVILLTVPIRRAYGLHAIISEYHMNALA